MCLTSFISRRKKKCIRVQMYLAGKSEQEIEATTFDEEGEAVPPLNSGLNSARGPGSRTGPGLTASHCCSSHGSDGDDSSGDQEDSGRERQDSSDGYDDSDG